MLMNVDVEPGTYIIAVSGGIDSMALLDMLHKKPGVELIVAHFDHGIRNDSYEDRQLVEQVAKELDLPFEYSEGKLGSTASEDQARQARYKFLNAVREKYNATAIITAHHQDDVVETVFINLIRGTGRKGLTSLKSSQEIHRPLLHVKKSDVVTYATEHNLLWREDSTNCDTRYLRNYIRAYVVPKLSTEQKQLLIDDIGKLEKVNAETDEEIAKYLQLQKNEPIGKKLIVLLDHREACEVMAGWLRLNSIKDFDRKTIERLVIASKISAPGSKVNINKRNYLEILHTSLAISSV